MKKFIISLAMAFVMVFSFSAHAENVKARLVIDTGPFGVHSWLIAGIKNGAFSKRGLDIEFVGTGPGSIKTGMALVSGKAEIGYQDYSGVVFINSNSTDPKVLAIFVVDDKAQDGVFALKSSGIKTFDDLDGRTLGGLPTGVTSKSLPAVTNAKWKIVPMQMPARVPALISGQVDAIDGFMTSNIFNLEKAGVSLDQVNVIKMSDKFPEAVSRVITVNTDWAASNPQAVRILREVSRELLEDFIKNPAASVAALDGPIVSTSKKVDIELRRAQYGIDELVNTPFVQKHGISNPSKVGPRMSAYTTVLVERQGLTTRHPDNKYFDLGE